MAIYKCKMCGGTLEVRPGESVCECEYCGTRQTIPSVMEENLQNLFNRANVLRMKAEFDKAAEIYERIVQADEGEAEAYWGLVLCKYGVEYVEDPVTFKRIPTCHRTSYEAVTADADYRGAIEHADASRRRIYEAEAKAIDEIQKGILAVAKKESPYDVFICYKEADENGKRTVDSTIANDIYYQLIQEDFKVFYSAITLEDKLGEEYEPYIFSALNSAKVMLVLGTKPEYFTAVWVKNEWSRFLKLMQNDRSRTLIPCYRDMDAYELPEEFAHLQAQDMAKIGFISDIIRGIKKLVAKPEESAGAEPQQPRVTQTVVQGGNANVDALIKRGNMSLEDQDWEKANEFFDRALDLDAECGMAYLGRALAENHISSLDEWAKAIGPESVRPPVETLQAGELDSEAESHIISENSVPGYLDKIEWEPFDLSYYSTKSGWVSARDSVKLRMEQNKNLNRAAQYGDAALRRQIDDCKKAILTAYDEKIAEAEQHDAIKKADARSEYAEFLQKQEKTAKEEKKQAEKTREEDYQKAVSDFEAANGRGNFIACRRDFTGVKLKDYKDSAKYAEECTARMAEIDAKKKRRKRIWIIAACCAVAAAVVVIILAVRVFVPNNRYNSAVAMLDEGNYGGAAVTFGKLGDYKDAPGSATEAWFEQGIVPLAAGAQHTVGLKSDGTVVATEYNLYGGFDVSDWSNIISVSAGKFHIVGLKTDGTVVATGRNYDGECDVSKWKDIVAVSAGTNHTVGLKADGTVVATDYTGDYYRGQCDVDGWTDIIAVSAGAAHTVGLKSNGTVVATDYTGYHYYGQCDVDGWTDIVAVSAGCYFTVGLKSDGTVVATGDNAFGQCDVSDWTDIVAVSAGTNHTVGLKSDGTVVATGSDKGDRCGVSGWTDIIAVTAGDYHTVGLKADGTVVAAGDNDSGQCDVSDWTDILVP